MSKPIQCIKNEAGGIDLLTERDSGNPVRILTGKPSCSKDFWKRLQSASHQALAAIEYTEMLEATKKPRQKGG